MQSLRGPIKFLIPGNSARLFSFSSNKKRLPLNLVTPIMLLFNDWTFVIRARNVVYNILKKVLFGMGASCFVITKDIISYQPFIVSAI